MNQSKLDIKELFERGIMGILNSIKEFFTIKMEPPLTPIEINLISQLKTNREIALDKIVPEDMKAEFLHSIYSNRHLETIVKMMYRDPYKNSDSRKYFLELSLAASLSIHGFGRNLILFYQIDPEIIYKTMLSNIEIS